MTDSLGLSGQLIGSDVREGVRYRIQDPLGEGGMGIAYYALRESQDGTTPAVVKVVRPEIVGSAGNTASLMIQKEAIALGRLNERVPPTPFVVRFLDNGSVSIGMGRRRVTLPWIAIEYVHGGPEGTTIEQRVEYSIAHTGYAFDCHRVAHALECLCSGMTAIHDVGVVHRDLTPGNVLCCGFGANEVFKIADFGIARPAGVTATFGNVLLGTPGYAAPEQAFEGAEAVGPWSDVFSLACVTFFVLTGEQYFNSTNVARALMMVGETKRRSVLEVANLAPELRAHPTACKAVDLAIARATGQKPAERPPTAEQFGATITPLLRSLAPTSQRASERLVASVLNRKAPETLSGWSWTVRHPPGSDRLIRSVAWDGDGHCLAITTAGLYFWNGTAWTQANINGMPDAATLRSVGLIKPGHFLVSAGDGKLRTLTSDGVTSTLAGPQGISLFDVSGDPADLAVAVGKAADSVPLLCTVAARRFFRPVPLDAATSILSIARVDDAAWLVAGRSRSGSGFCGLFSPLHHELRFLPTPPTDALVSTNSQVDRGLGIAVGRRGVTVYLDKTGSSSSTAEGGPDLASASVDVSGRAWAGGAGRLWTRDGSADSPWVRAWQNSGWQVPFVSLNANVGSLFGVTVDGAVLEGRSHSFA